MTLGWPGPMQLTAAPPTASIILVPSCHTNDVALWMAASDLVTLPSYAEGCPNAVVEALSSGRPVVATNVGGIPELVNETCGRLVPAKDVPALAAALQAAFIEQQRDLAQLEFVDQLPILAIRTGFQFGVLPGGANVDCSDAASPRIELEPGQTFTPEQAKLNGALNNALADNEVRGRLAADGTETLPGTPEAYAADIAGEETKWSEIIRKAGVKGE